MADIAGELNWRPDCCTGRSHWGPQQTPHEVRDWANTAPTLQGISLRSCMQESTGESENDVVTSRACDQTLCRVCTEPIPGCDDEHAPAPLPLCKAVHLLLCREGVKSPKRVATVSRWTRCLCAAVQPFYCQTSWPKIGGTLVGQATPCASRTCTEEAAVCREGCHRHGIVQEWPGTPDFPLGLWTSLIHSNSSEGFVCRIEHSGTSID